VQTESGAKIMSASDVADFRERVRLMLIERLVLQTALLARQSVWGLSVSLSAENLKGWLDANSEAVDRIYGEHFRDPALSALYADEVREIVDEMKAQVDSIAKIQGSVP
jgi:hypothetical protein